MGIKCKLYLYSRPSTGARSGTGTAAPPAITHRTTVPTTPTTATSSGTTTTPAAAPPPGLTTPQNASVPVNTPDAPRPNREGAAQRRAYTESTPSATNPIQLSDLQNFLQGISTTDQSGISGICYLALIVEELIISYGTLQLICRPH